MGPRARLSRTLRRERAHSLLNRNPQNFFAETEQVAFCVANVVPGIDFTNDPLLQARLFSYLDTQLTRLGGPNFNELPINRPVAPVHNHQQDGFGRQTVPTTRANYHPSSIGRGCPYLASPERGFVHQPQPVSGAKTRTRSPSFADHFGQARLFLNSQSPAERRHLVEAFQFELGKLERPQIRERVVAMFANVEPAFAAEIAAGLGIESVPAPDRHDTGTGALQGKKALPASPALSMARRPNEVILSRKIAVLVDQGVDAGELATFRAALLEKGACCEIIARTLGTVTAGNGDPVQVDRSFLTAASVLYDAVLVPGGTAALARSPFARELLQEAFHHCKPIAVGDPSLLAACGLPDAGAAPGVVATRDGPIAFAVAIARHRFFDRPTKPGGGGVPAE